MNNVWLLMFGFQQLKNASQLMAENLLDCR